MSTPPSAPGGSGGFRRVHEEVVHEGFVITLAVGTFEAPDGSTFIRDVVHHPGAVSVVPVHDDGTVSLVTQYRAAIDGDLLEIPAGRRDVPGEPPEQTAHRELKEEIGLRAGRLDLLAEFLNSPGFSDEYSHVYLGQDLTEVPLDLQGIEEQHMTTRRVPLDDVPAMISRGEIIDGKTIIGLTLALRHLGR